MSLFELWFLWCICCAGWDIILYWKVRVGHILADVLYATLLLFFVHTLVR